VWSCRIQEMDSPSLRRFGTIVSFDARWYTAQDVELEVLLGTDAGQIVLINAVRQEKHFDVMIRSTESRGSNDENRGQIESRTTFAWATAGEVLVAGHSQMARKMESPASLTSSGVGHIKAYNQVLALAVHPSRAEVTSACSNGELFVWDLESNEVIQVTTPTIHSAGREQVGQITACAYSNDGTLLAVGFGKCISEKIVDESMVAGLDETSAEHDGDPAFAFSDIEGDVAIFQALDLELMKVLVVPTGAITCTYFGCWCVCVVVLLLVFTHGQCGDLSVGCLFVCVYVVNLVVSFDGN
jgi:hypothetical protein